MNIAVSNKLPNLSNDVKKYFVNKTSSTKNAVLMFKHLQIIRVLLFKSSQMLNPFWNHLKFPNLFHSFDLCVNIISTLRQIIMHFSSLGKPLCIPWVKVGLNVCPWVTGVKDSGHWKPIWQADSWHIRCDVIVAVRPVVRTQSACSDC